MRNAADLFLNSNGFVDLVDLSAGGADHLEVAADRFRAALAIQSVGQT